MGKEKRRQKSMRKYNKKHLKKGSRGSELLIWVEYEQLLSIVLIL